MRGFWIEITNNTKLLPLLGDLSEQGPLFCISIADFEKNIVPTLCGSDCVIACMHGIETAHESGTRTDNESSRVDLAMEKCVAIEIFDNYVCMKFFTEYSPQLLNAVC